MRKAACIIICLVAVVATGAAQDLIPQEELRQLRAENRLLKAQIKALKRRLAAATSKPTSRPTTQAASRPGSATKPGTKTEAGSTAFTVILYEDNPKWWTNLEELAKEVATRQAIQQLEPKLALDVWLDNNKWFADKPVRWKLTVTRFEALTKSMAGEKYFRSMNNKAGLEKTLATQKRSVRGGKITESQRRAIASTQRQIRQHEAEAAQYKVLMDGDGGTLVSGGVQKPANITVVAAIPGGKKLSPGKRAEVSGKIVTTEAAGVGRYRRPGAAGSLQVFLVGKK